MSYTRKITSRSASADYSLHQQITSIAGALYHNKNRVRSFGLFNGRAGITLLFAYLAKTFPGDGYEAITHGYLEELRESLTRKDLSHSLSSGKAGIGFVFQHLCNNGSIDPSEGLDLNELDRVVIAGADRDQVLGTWDPVYGLVGLGIYFLERHKATGETKYLEKIVGHIESLSIEYNGQRVWTSNRPEQEQKQAYNFGMAHGMPGLLSFLARVYELGVCKDSIASLIPACLDFLLQHRASKDRLYAFPVSVSASSAKDGKTAFQPSWRHGWCYGDLGMALALIHCGRALGQPEWRQKGIAIALRTTAIPFEYAGCEDAPFCHGTVGLVHQYHRLYQATRNPRFRDAAENWLKLTMQHYYQPGKFPGGYAYCSFDEDERKLVNTISYGLLEGIAGIGLVYLYYLHGTEPGWDSIFQTNI
ncbi:lanthionine synthetase C family protein [Puia sp.]|jgi:lantibiotic modifying enzyme|uniref:lanthionine synthetase C family protein n=1 Tax=Puia sp. TaxID=2045100 RepID=UPI002F406542